MGKIYLYFIIWTQIIDAGYTTFLWYSDTIVWNGIGSVRPNYTFTLIIKKYFNEHNAYFNLK